MKSGLEGPAHARNLFMLARVCAHLEFSNSRPRVCSPRVCRRSKFENHVNPTAAPSLQTRGARVCKPETTRLQTRDHAFANSGPRFCKRVMPRVLHLFANPRPRVCKLGTTRLQTRVCEYAGFVICNGHLRQHIELWRMNATHVPLPHFFRILCCDSLLRYKNRIHAGTSHLPRSVINASQQASVVGMP